MRLWVGLVLLALGLLGVLDATGVLDSGSLVGRWWPVAIIGLGVVAMVAQAAVSTGPVVVCVVGLILLVGNLGWTTGDLFWPAVLVVAGLAVLAGLRRHRVHDHQSVPTPVVLFGGSKVRERSEHLQHSDISAVFGGATLDLRGAHIDTEASVDAFALFGGVEVLVPEGWRVAVGGLPFMGGIDDKTDGNGDLSPDAPLLTVNATAIFGGVEVKNKPSG
ncbi:hypothetical protein Lesp02_01290 [Lentzea sp. NBRC 105346]|nr:hypothetical protein Lesp02_01290 [Lentzea sp. NBRC 105346]